MRRFVLFALVLALLIFGCSNSSQISSKSNHNNGTNANTSTQTLTPVPVTPLPPEGISFSGTFPEQKEITYPTKSGESLIAPSAYPGFVYIYADDSASVEDCQNAIAQNGGTIVSAMPDAGLYLIQVPEGTEAQFLNSMYEESWVLDAIPASPAEPGMISVYDMFGTGNSNTLNCGKDHGDLTKLEAGRLGGSTESVNLPDLKAEGTVEHIDIARSMRKRMEQAGKNNENVVFSLSMQSKESGRLVSEDRSDCTQSECIAARQGQAAYYRTFLQSFNREIKNNPAAADHAILVIIAGNGGVDLDNQISDLRTKYPDAFNHVVVVGGTDINGAKDNKYNHLNDDSIPEGSTHPSMVYSLGNEVTIFGGPNSNIASGVCSGTSYAAPEVSAVLDYIWKQAPGLSASEVVDAFDQALDELGNGNTLPQQAGMTKQEFLDRAVAIAQEKAGMSPLGFSSLNFPDGTVDVSYQSTITPTGGIPPYIQMGVNPLIDPLPEGLEFSFANGKGAVSGTPAKAETKSFQLCVKDSSSKVACKSASITIKESQVKPPNPPDAKATISVDSARCSARERFSWGVASWTIDARGTVSGPVGSELTLSFTDLSQDCGAWGDDCIRGAGEPESASWHTQGNGAYGGYATVTAAVSDSTGWYTTDSKNSNQCME
ncbi:Uncharacterised protein [Candidatus Gugararchaeum adminiculabundum]|nr:Uncharacterised protein [Candidatus Gugararchaeum adminiculabundum]